MRKGSYGPGTKTASRRRQPSSRLPRPNRRPLRWDKQRLSDEIRLLEIAFEGRRNPHGIEPDLVVREMRRLRHLVEIAS